MVNVVIKEWRDDGYPDAIEDLSHVKPLEND